MNLGEVLSSVGNIGNQNTIGKLGTPTIEGDSFASVLKNAMSELNDSQVKGYDAMQNIATGKVDNLQEAVRAIEEAELSLKLGLEVKNKALGAYKQVMAMQI